MTEASGPRTLGVIGLGIMGSSVARHLAAAGWQVLGFDTDAGRGKAMAAHGVRMTESAATLARDCDVILTSLPSDKALAASVDALVGGSPRPGRVLVEMSTLSLEAKLQARERLAAADIAMLDCPISGTGAQAAEKDIVLLVSGDEAANLRCQPVFGDFSRASIYLGPFGNGTRMKFVANLLVAIHNVAAAEAIALGARCGLDMATLCDVLSAGAGNSRMLEVRGPMMVRGVYRPATMKLDVWQKDMRLIGEFARQVGAATPLFDATAPLYQAAVATGHGAEDTAAVRLAVDALATGPADK